MSYHYKETVAGVTTVYFFDEVPNPADIRSTLVLMTDEEVAAWIAAWTPPVPDEVSGTQGKLALIDAGKWQPLLDYIEAMTDEKEKARAQVVLNASVWRRDSVNLIALASALGMTDADLDALFTAAFAIVV